MNWTWDRILTSAFETIWSLHPCHSGRRTIRIATSLVRVVILSQPSAVLLHFPSSVTHTSTLPHRDHLPLSRLPPSLERHKAPPFRAQLPCCSLSLLSQLHRPFLITTCPLIAPRLSAATSAHHLEPRSRITFPVRF